MPHHSLKTVKASQVEMTELVLPNDTNRMGTLLGGRLMHWIDIAAAIAASRHTNRCALRLPLMICIFIIRYDRGKWSCSKSR
jgi:acyl-CoA hydrolase